MRARGAAASLGSPELSTVLGLNDGKDGERKFARLGLKTRNEEPDDGAKKRTARGAEKHTYPTSRLPAPEEADMALRLTSSLFARAGVAPRRGATRALASMGPSTAGTRDVSARPGGGGGSPARRHVRVRGSRGASSETTASSPGLAAPPWKEEVLDSHAALSDVCFVLCAPQGPQNCGAVARVMQNFGVYDLRLVNPGPFVLERGGDSEGASNAPRSTEAETNAVAPDGANARGGVNSGPVLGPDGLGFGDDLPPALRPTLTSETTNASETERDADATDSAEAKAPLCAEAYRFACAADWLLADASRHDSHVDALADCTFVMATTARPRGNVPLVTARVAAEMLVEESRRGKVAVLFGNERTGLTNEELAQAHACVAIPTAGQGALCRKSLKYTGGTGPTSLNLSQAVGVLAYELFMAADAARAAQTDGYRGVAAGAIGVPKASLMTVGEKRVLKNELIAARRTLDVLAGFGEDDHLPDDDETDRREERGVERVLNAAPLQRRDAAALFQLARRVRAIGAVDVDDPGRGDETANPPGGPLDEKVTRVVARLAENGGTPSVKRARVRVREALGLSLTDKEIARAIERARETCR